MGRVNGGAGDGVVSLPNLKLLSYVWIGGKGREIGTDSGWFGRISFSVSTSRTSVAPYTIVGMCVPPHPTSCSS